MIAKKSSKIVIIAAAIAAVLITATTLAALNVSRNISFDGTLTSVNIEVYSDSAFKQPCKTVSLGIVDPGTTVTQIIYINNNGTVPVTLSMSTSKWNPMDASSYLNLSWNRENYVLAAGQTIQATLTLTAALNTGSLKTFSFSATIIGTQ